MENSLREQLARDARKIGASQAKIALSQYLINHPQDKDLPQAQIMLTDVYMEEKAPLEYRIQAGFWLAKYSILQKNPSHIAIQYYEETVNLAKQYLEQFPNLSPIITETKLSCEALANIYKASDIARSNYYLSLALNIKALGFTIIKTADQTAEFLYKTLRLNFAMKSVTLIQYEKELIKLLNHVELTDTLATKIYYQLILTNMQKAHSTGEIYSLTEAIKYCNTLTQNNKLAPMDKSQRAEKIKASISTEIDQILLDVHKWKHRPQFLCHPERFFLVRLSYKFLNKIYLFFNHKKRQREAGHLKKAKIKDCAGRFLQTFSSETHKTHGVKDPCSNSASYVKIFPPLTAGKLAYSRVNALEQAFFIKINIFGNQRQFLCHKESTIANIKEDIQNGWQIPYNKQILTLFGNNLMNTDTIKDLRLEPDQLLELSCIK